MRDLAVDSRLGACKTSYIYGVQDVSATMRYETILVVENSEDDVVLLRRMFAKAKILNELQVVETVEDAICYMKGEGDYADREKYPFPIMIFLDLHVGGRSGFEVLQWIKSQRDWPTPFGIIVLSGSDPRAINDAYRQGADSFLVKPLRFDDFQNVVNLVRGVRLQKHGEGYYVRYG